jgi:hypothetical protein
VERSETRFVGKVLILPDHAKENVANPGDNRQRSKRPDTLRFGSIMRDQLYGLGRERKHVRSRSSKMPMPPVNAAKTLTFRA